MPEEPARSDLASLWALVTWAYDDVNQCPHFAVPDATTAADCICVFWAAHRLLEYEKAAREVTTGTTPEDPYTDDLF